MKRIASPRLVSVFASVLLLAAMLATPLAAHAQAAEDVWAAISVELYDLEEGKDPTLVITGRILDGIELPVDVSIAIPKDVGVAWMGQAVPDTNPDTWPQIEDAELVEGDDYNVVEFVLTEAPAVQLELVVPDEWITEEDGITTVDAEYISGGSSEAARIGVSTTHDYYLENADPEPIVDVRQTDIFYSVETSPVAEGDVLHISGTVAPGEAPELVELEAMMEEQAQAQEAECRRRDRGYRADRDRHRLEHLADHRRARSARRGDPRRGLLHLSHDECFLLR